MPYTSVSYYYREGSVGFKILTEWSYRSKITVICDKEEKAPFKFSRERGRQETPGNLERWLANKMIDREDQCAETKENKEHPGFPGVRCLWQSKINFDCAQ